MATRMRGIRVDDELWDRAAEICAAKDSDVSKEVRAFLTRLVARNTNKEESK